jgi:Mn-containing catalase
MSQGEGDATGSWNTGEQWEKIDDRDQQMAVDGGDGLATVTLGAEDTEVLQTLAARTQSDPTVNPVTGADLGAGPGAGKTTEMES